MSVHDLLANPALGLRKADTLPCNTRKNLRTNSALPALELGGVHEWFLLTPNCDRNAPWHPPLTLLGSLAMRDRPRGMVAWVGRSCWPTLKLLHDLQSGNDSTISLAEVARRCLFIDPATDKERFWVIEEVLRCSGIQAVVADGSKMTPTISRRLQLAAELGRVTALIARPPWEIEQPSWAMSRWQVRLAVADTGQPRWEIAASNGASDAQHHWTVEYEVHDGTGSFHLFADVGRGLGTAERQRHRNTA